MRVITVWVPEYFLEGLHELVHQKRYPHRSEIIRNAIRDLLKKELKGFIVNKDEHGRTRGCAKCGAPLDIVSDKDNYFCANCKSSFTF